MSKMIKDDRSAEHNRADKQKGVSPGGEKPAYQVKGKPANMDNDGDDDLGGGKTASVGSYHVDNMPHHKSMRPFGHKGTQHTSKNC